jgi:hypothetical protein
MSMVQSARECPVCQRLTLHAKDRPNHVLHLILTLVTFGLWGFVWLAVAIGNTQTRPRCMTCGRRGY